MSIDVPAGDEAPFLSTVLHPSSDPFRLLVEAVKDYGIFMLDPAGKVTSWNPGAENSKGYKAEEVIGLHISCFYTAEDQAAGMPEQGLRTALESGRLEEEGLRVRKNGESFWAVVTITSIHDAFGQHIGFANVTRDITERKQAEDALRLRDRAIGALVQGLCLTDPAQPDNPMVFANASFLRVTGYERDEVIGKNCRMLQGRDTSPQAVEKLRNAVREGRACMLDILNYRKDGTPFWNGLSISPIFDSNGTVAHFVGVLTDISPLKLLEDQFRQAQKMEAVGRLAGGVAHDFNNLLTVISGYSEMLLELLPAADPKREAVSAISEAGERAAGLTRQLLHFSRKAVLESRVLNVNDVVTETAKLLQRMLGEDIVFAAVLDPSVKPVRVDAGQVSQVLVNLAVNARDAMPQGGNLTIETSNVYLDQDYAELHVGCEPGQYVQVSVSDSGCGIDPEHQSRVFEPFFTTKPAGEGTGLGLATVYGIVKQCGGSINLYSELGQGTAFKVYFPAVDEPVTTAGIVERSAASIGGTETVLLVEDEHAVRAIATLALQTQGYTVLQADSGRAALTLIEQHAEAIALLATDVVMPGMSGRELADLACARVPGLRVLYLSGYTDDAVIRHGILQADVAFLQKPYTPLGLARKVRDVLDA